MSSDAHANAPSPGMWGSGAASVAVFRAALLLSVCRSLYASGGYCMCCFQFYTSGGWCGAEAAKRGRNDIINANVEGGIDLLTQV